MMQIDADEQPTPRSAEWLAGWASATTTARSQVDVALGERDAARFWAAGWRRAAQKYRMWWAASQETLGDLMHEHAATVAQGDAARYRAALENIEAESFEMFAVTVAAGALHSEPEGKKP